MSAYDDMVLELQRDINCLADPGRATRKRGLKKIEDFVDSAIGEAKKSPEKRALLERLYTEELRGPLLRVLSDSVEKCRLDALNVVMNLSDFLDCKGSLHVFVPVAHERLTSAKDSEAAEEIRLALLQVIGKLLVKEGASFYHSLDGLVDILAKSLADLFPDLKKECCTCITQLVLLIKDCDEVPTAKKEKAFAALTVPLGANLKHQHSRVRLSALQSLGSIVVSSGSDLLECVAELLPLLSGLSLDRAPLIRQALAEQMYIWLSTLTTPSKKNHGDLLLNLMSCTADDTDAVHNTAVEALDKLAVQFYVESEGLERDAVSWDSALGLPLKARPDAKTTRFVQRHLDVLIPPTISNLTDWTADKRTHAAAVLHALLVYAEAQATVYLDALLPVLYKTSRDSISNLDALVLRCVAAVGWLVPAEAWLSSIVKTLTGEVDTNYRSSCLVVLGNLVSGSSSDALAPHVSTIVRTMALPDLCNSESPDVRFFTTGVLANVIVAEPATCQGEVALAILLALLSLDAASSSAEEEANVVAKFDLLARCSAHDSLEHASPRNALFARHFRAALTHAVGPGLSSPGKLLWKSHSPECNVTFTLLKRSVAVVPAHLEVVMPLLVACADLERDPPVRINALSLLYRLVVEGADASYFEDDHVLRILRSILVPNLVWRAGRIAEAMRLQAAAVMHGVFARGLVSAALAKEVRAELFPVLHTNIDDDELQLRMAIVKIFESVFALTTEHLDYTELTDLHRDFLKRMDDSNDTMRIEVCKMYKVFMEHCFPPYEVYDVNNQHFGYMCKIFLVHLDDANPEVQRAVFSLLSDIGSYNIGGFIQALNNVKGKHTDASLVDRLLELAHGWKKNQTDALD
jgi:dynein assembly factor 5